MKRLAALAMIVIALAAAAYLRAVDGPAAETATGFPTAVPEAVPALPAGPAQTADGPELAAEPAPAGGTVADDVPAPLSGIDGPVASPAVDGLDPEEFEPLPETLGVLRASANTMTIDEYRLLAGRPVDGETALLLYFYVKSCIGRPRQPEQLEARIDYYDNLFDGEESVEALQVHEEVLGILQKHFGRCGGLAEFDLVALAVSWLQKAAGAGHVVAQVAFYEELPALLATTQDRIFREPHYIDLHQGESQRWLERALVSGHPDAFATMARAIMDGVVYEPDPPLALAHALVARAAADALDSGTAALTAELMATLGPTGIAEARRLARALCDRYPCPALP